MAKSELIQSLASLSKKLNVLLKTQQKLREQVKSLENENFELRKQHEIDLSLLDQAKKEIEFLSLSHRLASSPEALISARNKISELIRTIDSCIRIINED